MDLKGVFGVWDKRVAKGVKQRFR